MRRLIIDVREPAEYASGHVPGASNIPPAELLGGAPQLKDTPKDTEIIVYCLSGSRSAVAISILQQMGFTNLINGINQYHVQQKYL
jgi:phage shock protein E